MQKVAIIGAGNVGGLTAMRIIETGIADVVLVDVLENLAQAKALDIEDSLALLKRDGKISGSADFSLIKDCQVIVITAGFARKPGMTREELLKINADILKDIARKIKEYAPNSIIIVVTNPVDILSYLVYKISGIKKNRILGMGANLDTGRFRNLLAQKTNSNNSQIEAEVIGAHGEGMLPLSRLAKIKSKSIDNFLKEEQLKNLNEETIKRGAKIVSLFGSGSAYFAPSLAIYQLVEAIIKDKKMVLPVSCYLDGEFGLKDVFIGVPAKIGKNGIEKIIELDLNPQEKDLLQQAAATIKQNSQSLNV
jgi:malate dehydrogenase